MRSVGVLLASLALSGCERTEPPGWAPLGPGAEVLVCENPTTETLAWSEPCGRPCLLDTEDVVEVGLVDAGPWLDAANPVWKLSFRTTPGAAQRRSETRRVRLWVCGEYRGDVAMLTPDILPSPTRWIVRADLDAGPALVTMLNETAYDSVVAGCPD